jgi:hypothetical protein
MSLHMDIFDGTIRHHQAIFMIKILPVLRRAFDCLVHERRVFRMNPLEDQIYGWFRCSVVLEDSKSFLRPDDLSGEWLPAEATRMTESLRFRQVRLASLLGAPMCGQNTVCILQSHRLQ